VLFTKLAEQDSALKRQVEGACKDSRGVGFESHRAAQVFWYLDFIDKPAAKGQTGEEGRSRKARSRRYVSSGPRWIGRSGCAAEIACL